jgi:hypothetical protein
VERREAEQWPRRIGHGWSSGGVRRWQSSEGGDDGVVAAGSAAVAAGTREERMGGTGSGCLVRPMWRRGEAVEATTCHPYAGDSERLPRGGRGLSVVERWRVARAGTDAGQAGLPS